MDPRCRINLLGPLCVIQAHQTVTRFRTQKAAALLAYFALRPGPHAREQVIDLFWPEMDLAAGRGNLSTTLSGLRRRLEPPGIRPGSVLVTTHAQVGLDPAAVTTDVVEFERFCAEGETAASPDKVISLLNRAVNLYAGDFQEGNFQDWAVRESERLHARLVSALDRLGEAYETLERFAEAGEAARRRVSADPYTEEAHVALVRRLVRSSQRGAALEAARSFEQFFEREFGEGSARDARRAMEEFLGEIGPAAPVSRAPLTPPPPALSSQSVLPADPLPTPPLAPIPFWLSRFFGREREMLRLASLLLPPKGSGAPLRLTTLLGPGGTGKTRLAAEFARRAGERFGLWRGFVPLADLNEPEQIAARIAHSLRLPPGGDSQERIAAFFVNRERPEGSRDLLVLDNMEQLLAGGGEASVVRIVAELLARSPELTILCTSRRPLGVQGERTISVEPLEVPDAQWETDGSEEGGSSGDLASLLEVPSVRLYVDRAQALRPEFGLSAANAASVAALCRALEGSPLALELAASWVRLLPPRKMWERLSQGLGTPETRLSDLPDRQRSLEASLEWSWRLLTPAQQRLLAGLSIFRGGWDLRAAETVCAEPGALELLADLQEASLVTASETGDGDIRYGLLESVRVFSQKQRDQRGETETLRTRHLSFFADLAAEAAPDLYRSRQAYWLDALETEHDNLRAALEWTVVDPSSRELGLRLVSALAPFWRARGYLQEGYDRCAALLSGAASAGASEARIGALNAGGLLASLLAKYAEADAFHQEALEIARAQRSILGESAALLGLGTVRYWRYDYPAAERLLQESLSKRFEARVDKPDPRRYDWEEAATHHTLGNLAIRLENYAEAQAQFGRALDLRRAAGDTLGVAGTLGALGQVALAQGEYDTAEMHLRESQHIFDSLGQRWTAALCLAGLSRIAEERGTIALCARLLSAAMAVRKRHHFPLPPAERPGHEEQLRWLTEELGASAFNAAWSEGQTLSWEQSDVVPAG
ncbi:hypothetical protein CCAX7_32550 [Capsulimonas corticalis]|uniref:Uncharacterized protein n=1 Tax=Capsulimonas corticalis TaxID=2219043 RepID=A0A402D449_9BACT|nr:tetratricopeptide repeat protein [Capsulimonas corticalis]BDI31204.1 hypothetical protein CCAX7_32550 [Capsulimonas corticalis]